MCFDTGTQKIPLYPGIHIRITNHSTPQALSALKEGNADIAVVTTPITHSASLTEISVKSIKEVAVCSSSFPSLVGKRISLEELTNYPLISPGSDTKSFEFYSSFFTKHNLPYRPDIEAFSADQILLMVEEGLGIGFVPEEFISQSSNIKTIDLSEKIPERSICLVKRKDQPLSVATKALEKMIIGNYK